MRAGFGLVALLVCIGVMVWFWGSMLLPHTQAVLKQSDTAKKEVNQFGGFDRESGKPAKLSATLELQQTSGKSDSILVTKVVAGGAYELHWGLKRNDSIVEVGPLPVREQITDHDSADDFVQEAYQRQWNLTVLRDGQRLTLPTAETERNRKSNSAKSLTKELDDVLKSKAK